MQLQMDYKFASYVSPKSQLLKWVGNKQRFASAIAQFFPQDFKTFYEPFLGSGAVMATVSPKRGVGSDNYKPLMEIWQKLKEDPKELVEWYAERRDRMGTQDKVEVYEQVKASFNACPNGADFVFLSRSCYGGIVRFRKSDGYMTPCGVHTPIPVQSFAKRVEEWKGRLRNVTFRNVDYKEIFAEASEGDMIYCDPLIATAREFCTGRKALVCLNCSMR